MESVSDRHVLGVMFGLSTLDERKHVLMDAVTLAFDLCAA